VAKLAEGFQTDTPSKSKLSLCMFCDTELGKETKPEHILLSALGGRKTTKRAICSYHNNLFGSTIDQELAGQVPILRNMFQMESGTGKAAPALRGLQSGNDRINLCSDGTPELIAKPFTITDRGDGTFDLQVMVRSEEELGQIVPHIAARIAKTEEEVWNLLAGARATKISRPAGAIHFPLSFGGTDAIRSIAKSLLVLIASKVGTESIRTEALANARKFVLDGSDTFTRTHSSLDSRLLPGVDLLEERFGPLFNLLYVRSDQAGRTIGYFTLYNLIAWQVVLAESGGPPNLSIGLASNPMKPADWSDGIANDIDISLEWLDSPDQTDILARGQQRMVAAMEHYVQTGREREIGRIVDKTLGKYFQPGEHILDEDRTRVAIAEMADRVTRMLMGIPMEESVTIKRPDPATSPDGAPAPES